jgi:hypothetical protein
MSASKDQYMESLQFELHCVTNGILEETKIQLNEIAGIKEDLQRLYHHIQQQQQEKENG